MRISSGNYEFSVAGEKNGNSGEIIFQVGDLKTKLGVNIQNQAGEILWNQCGP